MPGSLRYAVVAFFKQKVRQGRLVMVVAMVEKEVLLFLVAGKWQA